MKTRKSLLAILALLVVLSMACSLGATQAIDEPAAEEAAPAAEENSAEEMEEAEEPPAASSSGEAEFPLPEDVKNVDDLGNGAINFQTSLSLPDAVTFYRFAFMDLGYTEREINTSIEDTTFSMVFDGHESGKAIVIQGVDLGENVNINIRFEDI